VRALAIVCAALVLLTACATHPDSFYVLEAQPGASTVPRTAFTSQILLHVAIPSLIDRPQMVLSTTNGVALLEHQRWAAPLGEQISHVLGQNIESRRPDVLVTDHEIAHPAMTLVRMQIDVVQVTASQGARVTMETRWQVVNVATGQSSLGREVFSAPDPAADYAAVAKGISTCLGMLSDRLVQELPKLGSAAS
jgi:uncharacterized protein